MTEPKRVVLVDRWWSVSVRDGAGTLHEVKVWTTHREKAAVQARKMLRDRGVVPLNVETITRGALR